VGQQGDATREQVPKIKEENKHSAFLAAFNPWPIATVSFDRLDTKQSIISVDLQKGRQAAGPSAWV
jgi:hypothetical protein